MAEEFNRQLHLLTNLLIPRISPGDLQPPVSEPQQGPQHRVVLPEYLAPQNPLFEGQQQQQNSQNGNGQEIQMQMHERKIIIFLRISHLFWKTIQMYF